MSEKFVTVEEVMVDLDVSRSTAYAGERGWRYSAALLERHGAPALTDHTEGRSWLATWLPRITRTARHPGCLRYAWALDRRLRRHMPEGLPYLQIDPRSSS